MLANRDPLIAYAARSNAASKELIELADEVMRHPERALAEATQTFREAASLEVPFAMCVYARLVAAKKDCARSQELAFELARRASDLGFAGGHYELARCYEDEIGTARDLSEAVSFYRRAAEAGFGYAAYRLGLAYLIGEFGERDVDKAIAFLQTAAEAGESVASYTLGEWFEEGKVVKADFRAALDWYRLASSLGSSFASFRISKAYMLGELGQTRNSELATQFGELSLKQSASL